MKDQVTKLAIEVCSKRGVAMWAHGSGIHC